MIIELLIKAIEAAVENRRQPQQQPQWTWEQQQAWEEHQRALHAHQLDALQRQGAAPVAAPPLPAAATRRRRVSAAPPPLPEDVPVGRVIAPPPRGRDDASARPAAARATTADAAALARWMRPATLRSQFVLTEILKPPLALRPPRE